jgi:hypothetical protein
MSTTHAVGRWMCAREAVSLGSSWNYKPSAASSAPSRTAFTSLRRRSQFRVPIRSITNETSLKGRRRVVHADGSERRRGVTQLQSPARVDARGCRDSPLVPILVEEIEAARSDIRRDVQDRSAGRSRPGAGAACRTPGPRGLAG